MRLDETAAEFMDFRHKEFTKQLKEINDIVTGRNSELSAFINDENGNVSDQKIERLISDLMECLINYRRQLYKYIPFDLSDETRELYECFLYCTIQGVAHIDYVDLIQHTPVRSVSTFSDILDVLYNSFTYRELRELLYIEQLGYPIASSETGFFRCCDLAYEILTGTDIMAEFTEKEAEIVNEMRSKIETAREASGVYEDDYGIDEDDYEKQFEREQLSQAPPPTAEELYERLYGVPDEYEQLISDDELEEWERVNASHEAWKNALIDPDKFVAKYLRYRELYFTTDHSDMKDDIEKMIDVFLYEQGLSSFSLGDRYAMITYRTDHYRNVLRSDIRKARC